MKNALISLFALALVVGCGDKDDTGDTGDSGNGGADDSGNGGGDDTGTGDTVDSCDWTSEGICVEFVNYDGTSDWCDGIAADYGFTVAYSNTPCSTTSVAVTCDIPAGGDYPVAATALYYSPDFDATTGADACESANGTVQ